MAFQIKNFPSIVAAMINHMRGTQTAVTDYNIGSVARTLIEAPAVEIDELYQQAWIGLREAIPVATYGSFNFARLTPVAASGVIRLTVAAHTEAVVVQSGTVFASPNAKTTYSSVSAVTLPPGTLTADILVTAAGEGALGNLSAGAAFTATPVPASFVSATNPASFLNGRDVETDDERKQRFTRFISTLSRATDAALIYGAKTVALYDVNGIETERVKAVSVVVPYLDDNTQPTALVEVYIHNGVGATSAALVARTSKVLYGYTDADGQKVDGWSAAGVRVLVFPAIEVPLNIVAQVKTAIGFDPLATRNAVKMALADYILSLDIGEPFLFADAVHLAMSIDGVLDIHFDTPVANLPADRDQKIIPGTSVVTAL